MLTDQERGICGLPDWAEDRIITDLTIRLSWRNRFWALLSGALDGHVEVTVERRPGRMVTEARVLVRHPRWPWRRRMEMATASPGQEPRDGRAGV